MPASKYNVLRESVCIPEQRALLDYWLAVRGERRMPGRLDIAPESIPRPALPHVGLIDVLPDGRFRYRLIGTAMAAFYGRDYTGTIIEQGKAKDYASVLNRLYGLCARGQAAVYSESCMVYRQGLSRIMHRLLLPLSTNGDRVDMIFFSTVPGRYLAGDDGAARLLGGDDVIAIDPAFEPVVVAA